MSHRHALSIGKIDRGAPQSSLFAATQALLFVNLTRSLQFTRDLRNESPFRSWPRQPPKGPVMRAILGACALCCGIFSIPEADASVRIHIDLSAQTMHVTSDMGSYDWRVSTARSGYRTPRGSYRPYQLLRMHYSHKYHMSPMPF